MARPDLQQFDALFEQVIAPTLAPLETERQLTLRRFWRRVALSAAGGVIVALLFSLINRGIEIDALFWTALFVVLVGAGLCSIPVFTFQQRCKIKALGELARALDMTYVETGFEPAALERIKALRLIDDNYDQSEFEDLFSGSRSGAAFQLYEARMSRKSGKNRVTTFAGQILRIAFPKKFLGTTVVNRDSQRWFPPPGLQRVGLESSQFERIFEVFGDDQVEARFLVHPSFMERLMALETSMKGKNIRCAFDDAHLLVAVEGPNLFELVDVFKPLPDRENTRKGVGELQAVLALIDAILAPPPNVWAQPKKS